MNNFSSHENIKLKVFHIFLYSVNVLDISFGVLNLEFYFLENTHLLSGVCRYLIFSSFIHILYIYFFVDHYIPNTI